MNVEQLENLIKDAVRHITAADSEKRKHEHEYQRLCREIRLGKIEPFVGKYYKLPLEISYSGNDSLIMYIAVESIKEHDYTPSLLGQELAVQKNVFYYVRNTYIGPSILLSAIEIAEEAYYDFLNKSIEFLAR